MGRSALVGVAVAGLALSACGVARGEAGPTVERNYSVGAFDRIEVAGPYEVQVHTGAAPAVEASGPEELMKRMVVEVENGTLKIHPEKRSGFRIGWSRGHEPVRLVVSAPALSAAEIAGSGEMRIDQVRGDSFEGSVAGSGDLRIQQLQVGRASMDIAGSGKIRAAGRAGEAHYDIAGSGDIDATGLAADRALVSIAGSGNIKANATQTAKVDIAGSGNVRLQGGAKCEVSKIGAGNVDCS